MKTGKLGFIWLGMLALLGVWSLVGLVKTPYQPSPSGLYSAEQLDRFSSLPVQANGRIKPIDSIARETLMFLSHKQTVVVEDKKVSAMAWYVDVLTNSEAIENVPFIKLIDDDIKQEFKLPLKEKMFSIHQLSEHYGTMRKKAEQYQDIEKERRSFYQRHMLDLYHKMSLYIDLKQTLFPSYVKNPVSYVQQQTDIAQAHGHLVDGHDNSHAAHGHTSASDQNGASSSVTPDGDYPAKYDSASPAGHEGDDHIGKACCDQDAKQSGSSVKPAAELSENDAKGWAQLSLLVKATQFYDATAVFGVVPTTTNDDKWLSNSVAISRQIFSGKHDPIVMGYARFIEALVNASSAQSAGDQTDAQGNSSNVDQALSQLENAYKTMAPDALKQAKQEQLFNRTQFFYKALVLYILATLFVSMAAMFSNKHMYVFSFRLATLACGVQVVGLILRMMIQGRPPVTNLYSSAVFIGLIAVVLGLIFEAIFKQKMGIFLAGIIGFITLIIAHHLSIQGDTLEMMQAVLDSNFWLATHVVVVTIGYSGMFLAGGIGLLYIMRRFFSRTFPKDLQRDWYKMAYASICFSLALSFIGTVLGGIWADQSWGRFWGWDPKENGALLIVIWCAILLHARLAGMIQARGFMVGAVFGNVVTAFSWFGVNMLGVGLHSYGFMDEAFFWLLLFTVVNVFFMVLGILPSRWVTPKISTTK